MDLIKTTVQYNHEKTLKTKPYVLRALYRYRNKLKAENPERVKQANQLTYQNIKEKRKKSPEFDEQYKNYKNTKNQEYRQKQKESQQTERSILDATLLDMVMSKMKLAEDIQEDVTAKVGQFLQTEIAGNTVLHHLVCKNRRKVENVYGVVAHHVLAGLKKVTIQSTVDCLHMTRPTFLSISKEVIPLYSDNSIPASMSRSSHSSNANCV